MSRYTITVTSEGRIDPDAVIGYDSPLRTFFLPVFPHEVTDDPALWLGTFDHEFETLDGLHHAALAEGYHFTLPEDVAARLTDDKARDADKPQHDRPLAAFLRHLQSE